MFSVKHLRFPSKKTALFKGDVRILLFDEVPVLFTGKNFTNSFLIGSNLEIDYNKGIERYLHSVVTPEDFRLFQSGHISYLEVLHRTEQIFVIDRYAKSGKEKIAVISFSQIPQDLLPSTDSFFPRELHEPTLAYSTKLEGGPAEDHLAYPSDVNLINNNIADALGKALNALRHQLGFGEKRQLAPATQSSYGINFVITLTQNNLLITEETLAQVVNDFTEYCFQELPSEVDALLKPNSLADTPAFDRLFEKVAHAAHFTGKNDNQIHKQEIREILRKDVLAVPKLLQPIAAAVAKNYSSFDVNNQTLNLGHIDKSFEEIITKVLEKIEKITVDDGIKSFRITVYQFNTHSGHGRADLDWENTKESIRFHIVGFEDGYDSTLYIDSMKNKEWIMVSGLMSFKADKPEVLGIQ